MYVYNYRIRSKYDLSVASFALLADSDPEWHPTSFEDQCLGTHTKLMFPVTKLLDYRERQEELAHMESPLAMVLLAIMKVLETETGATDAMAERADWKLRVLRSLYERGIAPSTAEQLFRFIDWVVRLPAELDDKLYVELARTEQDKKMTYVTSFERYGIKKGLKQGRLVTTKENILEVLEGRFDMVSDAVKHGVENIKDVTTCKRLLMEAVRAASLEEFETTLLREMGV
ncbi:MAG: hypothetical protein COV99_00280 [Bacteroidetes bacterium CG12_big_fil_rev_8_21_14_0_65_60_17]|nr:MAG: hypothetical protein COV99_00280 [Bacteroidetes bacterium CG12_big_fil_rev_8_21_14_0_65_60_17]